MSEDVVLTMEEMELACLIGCKRRCESKTQSRKDGHGLKDADYWSLDIEGAAAEMAYCKFRNLFWSGTVKSFKRADCGYNVQVRSTRLQGGSLIVRKDDSDNDFFVLVTGAAPRFRVVGWIKGVDAKVQEFEKDPGNREPAFFIPQSALRKFASGGLSS